MHDAAAAAGREDEQTAEIFARRELEIVRRSEFRTAGRNRGSLRESPKLALCGLLAKGVLGR